MTRPTRWKFFYAVALVLLSAVAIAVANLAEFDWAIIVAVGIALLIPGRINGHYWRDFYTGRQLMNTGRNNEALRCFERFLGQVQEQPQLKHLIWFVWGIYTRDIEAMTQNNIGAVLMREGHLDLAEKRLKLSLSVDAQYPIPNQNLAIIAELRGDRDTSIQFVEKAEKLGYRDTSIDKVVSIAGNLLAAIEGRP